MYLRVIIICALAGVTLPGIAEAMSLKQAVQRAVSTHPSVDAARAGRRAAGWELREAQGRFLPSLDLGADAGPQFVDKPESLPPDQNAEWRLRRQVTGTVTQVLFNGWERANDVYRRAARVDAAAYRVLDRSQVLALDAVEAYIDVRRHLEILAIARRNRARLEQISGLVRDLLAGGKVPQSDVEQTGERLAAADAVIAQIRQALEEAEAKFEQVVGVEPARLEPVGIPPAVPGSEGAAFAAALANHPRLHAAGADAQAAFFALQQAKGAYYPEIALQGSATYGHDLEGIPGRNVDITGKVVLSWNLFDGFRKTYRTRALSEEFARAKLEEQVVARELREAVGRAFAAYQIGGERVAAVQEQVNAARRLVRHYEDEYKVGRRSLLDLLDAESALFSSQFQLASVMAVRTFAAYQLLATMGRLLAVLGIAVPPEATATVLDQIDRGPLAIGVGLELEPLRK